MTIKNAIRRLVVICAGLFVFSAQAQTISGNIKGLTVAVSFTDSPFTHPIDSITNMMNQPGFSGWGNMGSVRDYFYTQTNGMVTLTTTVVKVNYPNTVEHFFGPGASTQIADVIGLVNQQYPQGFTNLTIDPRDGNLMYFNILCKAGKGAWAFGSQGNITILNNGQSLAVTDGNITTYGFGQVPEINTICHETGHNLMSWTDYYRTAFCNLGDFDLMASGGTLKAPMPINPGLRFQRGWIPNVINVPGDVNATYTLTANSYNTIHKYTNPNNPKEYLLFHAMKVAGYYQSPMDNGETLPEGLAIWYIDEETGFNSPGQDSQFFVKLIQADNLDEMHDEYTGGPDVRGDMDDLYGNAVKSFPNGHPLRWKDGGEFGINIVNISNPGNTMTFQVLARPSTVVASTDMFGSISPKGTLSSTNGGSKSFTLIPDIGYEINTLKVNGTTVTPTNPYVMNGISGSNNTIQATFKRTATLPVLPTPWQRADIGSFSTPGLSGHSNGSFNLESYGSSIGGTSDNCHFLYQTLNGDGSLIAHVASFNRPTWNQRVGIMIRESLQSGAAQSSMMKVVFSGNQGAARASSNAWLAENPNGLLSLHIYQTYDWLKVTRLGDQVYTYCSHDGVNWLVMSQQSVALPTQAYIGLFVTGATSSYPAKAVFDNVRMDFTTTCSISGSKLNGNIVGTEGSWAGLGNTRDKAFDNNIFTYFDGPQDVSWTGLDLSNAYRITGVRFFPRQGATYRMTGGKFQGSNVADFSSGVVDLATITTEPAYDWNCVTVSNTTGFRYVRYICPPDGYGNVSEIEFVGTPVTNVAPVVSITSPLNNSNFTAPATILFAANASDADGTVSSVEFFNGTTSLGIDNTAPYGIGWTNVAAGTYTITARATDNGGAITTSAAITVVVNSATQSPYGGTAWVIPGTIEAENYDLGGQNMAYYDASAANEGGAYRSDMVDVEANAGGFNVGWIMANEWLEYTVNITSAGNYTVDARVASIFAGKTFRAELDGVSIGTFTVANTGAWQTWQNAQITANNLTTGTKVLRLFSITGDFNLDKVVFTKINTNVPPQVSITSPANGTSFTAPAMVSIAANASDADGTVSSVEFYNGTTLLGTDNTSPYTFSWTNVAAGTYSLTARATDNSGSVTTSALVSITVTNPSMQSPYGGTAWGIPGTIETENYDLGGQNIAYYDASAANEGNGYRTDAVDIEATPGGWNVGWIMANEWLEYTVNITSAGNYTMDARVASSMASKNFRVELDGVSIATVNVPQTGGWQNWQTISATVNNLTVGQKVLRIYSITGDFNLDKLIFTKMTTNVAPSVSITAPVANATFAAPANITITANATDADGTIASVQFYNGATLLATDNSAPYSYSWVSVAAGSYSVTARATDNGGAVTTSTAVSLTVTSSGTQSPYGGTAWNIPGIIEAENYDLGGQSIAFNDLSTGNAGNAYRTDAVDMEGCSEGGYNVGWTQTGEWLEYTVNVAQGGVYIVDSRIASNASTGIVQYELNGTALTGTIVVPNTGGWQNWQTIASTSFSMAAGSYVLRVKINGGDFNLNKFEFRRIGARLTDLNDVENEASSFSLYPNPMMGSDVLRISGEARTIAVKVISSNGTIVIADSAWNTAQGLNLATLNSGAYQIVIEDQGTVSTTTIVR